MNVLERLAIAVNQSFRLIFESINRGILLIYRKTKSAISIFADLVKWFHELVTTVIQLSINISSIALILFVPFGFFFDPLNWSQHLENTVSPNIVFWTRMGLGAFFLLVACLVVTSLFSSWKKSADTSNKDAVTVETDKGDDFVRMISGFLSWILIVGVFCYFTVYRYQLLHINLSTLEVPSWLNDYIN